MSQDRPPNFLWSVTNSLGSIGQRYRRKRKLDAPMPLPPMTLSPSWSLPVTAQGSTYEAARLLAASVASNPPREFLAEKDMAITLVQKRIRRNQCLARLWDVEGGGLFVQWQCVKIQRRWRGTRGRAEGHVLFHRRVFLAAARVNALYMGMRARRLARELRVAIAEKAALKLQTVYRGRLGAKFFMKWREMRRTESVKFLQRCYRGYRGRLAHWQRSLLMTHAVSRLAELTAKTREFKALRKRHRLDMPPEAHRYEADGATLRPWAAVATDVASAVVYEAERLVAATPPDVRYAEGVLLGVADDARDAARSPLLHAAHALLVGAQEYDLAADVLAAARRRRPGCAATLYASAVALQLGWSVTTKHKVAAPDRLDRALALLAAARRVDPDRRGYAYWEFAYLAGARRWSPRSAPVRCIVGVAISSVHGDLYLERHNGKYASTGPERLREAKVLKRSKFQYGLAVEYDPDEVYLEVKTCVSVNSALFMKRRKKFVSRVRAVSLDAPKEREFGSYVEAPPEVEERDDGDDASSPASPASAPTPPPPPAGDGAGGDEGRPWVVNVYECVPKYVCWAEERTGDGTPGRRTRDYVLHESDLDFAVAKHFPRSEALSAKKNGQLADVIHGELVLAVDDDAAELQRDGDPARPPMRLVLPDVRDVRDSEAAKRVEHFSAQILQRGYKGFDSRSLFKRIFFQLKQRDIQSARLAIRRAEAHLRRLRLHRAAAYLQSQTRGAQRRHLMEVQQRAVLHLQRRARGTRARKKLEEEARRKLEGARVEAVYSEGRTVSGTYLMLTVKRCGLNFKFVGQDMEQCLAYFGYVHAPAVLKLLENWHAAHPKDPIRKWQHKRVLQLLLDNVALVSPITAPTAELANLDVRRALVVDPDRGAKIAGPGLQEKALDRLLKDTKKCLRDHRARVAADRKKQAARGLPPTEPSRQQREIAKGRFKARLGANPISAKVMAAKRKEERKAARAREEAKQAKEERERKAAAGPAAGEEGDVTNYLDDEPEPDSD